jgi:hypothetical protein
VRGLLVALTFLAASAAAPARAEEPVRSGLHLGLAVGGSLTPPQVCRDCVRYQGLGLGFSIDAGWALTPTLALDFAYPTSVMLFADRTNAFLSMIDGGLIRWRGPWWGRAGLGAGISTMTSADFGEKFDGTRAWRRFGPGLDLAVGHERGDGRWKLGFQARLLAVKLSNVLTATVLVMLDLSRS